MSFLFETVSIPIWFLLVLLGSSAPVWIKLYKKFHKKFITTGILQKKLDEAKTVAEMKVDVLKKATENWNVRNKEAGAVKTTKKSTDPADSVKKKHSKSILKVLAKHGERGMLLQSITDTLDINSIETNNSLTYLIDNDFVEPVNGPQGTVYHLTKLGRNYCIKKGVIPS